MLVPNKVDPILKDLSLRFYKDIRVVKFICDHPLFFVAEKMKDPDDIRAIMVPFFGKFVFKYGKTLENKRFNRKKYDQRIAHKRNQKENLNVTENKINE